MKTGRHLGQVVKSLGLLKSGCRDATRTPHGTGLSVDLLPECTTFCFKKLELGRDMALALLELGDIGPAFLVLRC